LLEQLQASGVQPAAIQHVVITHAHQDHFDHTASNGQPSFPNARYYLGRADWERAEMQTALQNPESVESRTLGVVSRAGLLERVEGDHVLGEGVSIIAAPGETPGHQIVRVQSQGQTLYCVGDLYHHIIEVEHPEWAVRWANEDTILASRRAFAAAALAENALIIATHITGVGRLQQNAQGVTWVSV
jgi:glyoxylase-like metal-dependent hydrolase (beta-lactamase superfamily II)